MLDEYDYVFAENGLTAYKLGTVLPSQSFIKFLGEDRYKPMVNFILHYLADIDIPIKRYVLIEKYHDCVSHGSFKWYLCRVP